MLNSISLLTIPFRLTPLALCVFLTLSHSSCLLAQKEDQKESSVLMEVQLPIQNSNIGSITRALDTAIDSATKAAVANQRPLLLLRFLPASNANQLASDFGACNTLESYLSSPDLTRRCRTVAVLDGQYADHALLPALACSKLIVSPETSISGPEADTSLLTKEIRDDYKRVAEAHKHLPASVVEAVLDPAIALHEVTTDESTAFVTGQKRQELLDNGKLNSSTGVSMSGDAFILDRVVLARQSAISIIPTNDATLTSELNIAPTRFLKSSGPIGELHAVVIDMSQLQGLSRIRDKQTLINNLADDHNLIIFQLQNDGAHADELLQLAILIPAGFCLRRHPKDVARGCRMLLLLG